MNDILRDAILFIEEVVAEKLPLSERFIKDLHGIILRGIDVKNAGIYRSIDVIISESGHFVNIHPFINREKEHLNS